MLPAITSSCCSSSQKLITQCADEAQKQRKNLSGGSAPGGAGLVEQWLIPHLVYPHPQQTAPNKPTWSKMHDVAFNSFRHSRQHVCGTYYNITAFADSFNLIGIKNMVCLSLREPRTKMYCHISKFRLG